MLKLNRILTLCDSYKLNHFVAYPEGMEDLVAYVSSRGGKFPRLMVSGIQTFVQLYLVDPVTVDEVEEARAEAEMHGNLFNYEGWMRIASEFKGVIPIEILGLKEGTVVPQKVAVARIKSTHDDFAWLVTLVETALLRSVWYSMMVATTGLRIRAILKEFVDATCDDPSVLDWKLHNFGDRGTSSDTTATLGSVAFNSTGFKGTDTTSVNMAVRQLYGDKDPVAFSIPASEHSVTTTLGREGEVDQMRRFLNAFDVKRFPLIAYVSDGYDIFNACENLWGGVLREEVIARGKAGGLLVIRPDSGDALKVNRRIIEILGEKFGYTINDKGFKVLNYVRIIQGDGVNETSIHAICEMLMAGQWSIENIAFGMGGDLIQNHARDDNKFAMKASEIQIKGKRSDVFKDPVTDKGKSSFKGFPVTILNDACEYETVRDDDDDYIPRKKDEMVVYYYGGSSLSVARKESYAAVRARANLPENIGKIMKGI